MSAKVRHNLMRARLLWVVVLAAFTVASVVVPLLFRAPEPIHDGKRVSAWIQDLSRANEAGYSTPHPSRDALRAMGDEALPYLARVVATKDSGWERFYARAYSIFPGWMASRMPIPMKSTKIRREAAFLIQSLSHGTREVVPLVGALTNSLAASDGDLKMLGVSAIAAIAKQHQDEGAVAALIRCLDSPDLDIVGPAASALADWNAAPSNAIPSLQRCLTNSSCIVRVNAAFAWYRATGNAEHAVEVLVQALRDRPVYRQFAAMRLGQMGAAARAAAPALSDMTNDPVPFVSQWARTALQQVTGTRETDPE